MFEASPYCLLCCQWSLTLAWSPSDLPSHRELRGPPGGLTALPGGRSPAGSTSAGQWPRNQKQILGEWKLTPNFLAPSGFSWLPLAPPGSSWLSWPLLARHGSSWLLLAPPGSSWLLLAPPGSSWLPLAPPGSSWLLLVPFLLAPHGSSWLLLAPPGSSHGFGSSPPKVFSNFKKEPSNPREERP